MIPNASEELSGLIAELKEWNRWGCERAKENGLSERLSAYRQGEADGYLLTCRIAEPYEARRLAAEKRCAIYEEALEDMAACLGVEEARQALNRADREAPWPERGEPPCPSEGSAATGACTRFGVATGRGGEQAGSETKMQSVR